LQKTIDRKTGYLAGQKENSRKGRSHENKGSWAHEPFSCLKLEIFEDDVCRKKIDRETGYLAGQKENCRNGRSQENKGS